MTSFDVQVSDPNATVYQITTVINDVTYQVSAAFGAGPRGATGAKGDKGDKGDTGPAGLTWRMVWDAGTQYAVDDAVYYSGSSYYAVAVPDVGTAPDPASQSPWMELAIMGQKGDKGDTGATGPAGAGVPDTTGATSGEVVRWNGTTTEWHQLAAADISDLGTAATANTGTTSGTVPVLNANGRLDMARLASGTPDGTKFIRDDGTLVVPSVPTWTPTWTTPTVTGSSAPGTGYTPLRYCRDPNGFVHIEGSMKFASAPSGTLFTLPAGYRPAGTVMAVAISDNASAYTYMAIKSDGTVTVGLTSGTSTVTCEAIVFYAAS